MDLIDPFKMNNQIVNSYNHLHLHILATAYWTTKQDVELGALHNKNYIYYKILFKILPRAIFSWEGRKKAYAQSKISDIHTMQTLHDKFTFSVRPTFQLQCGNPCLWSTIWHQLFFQKALFFSPNSPNLAFFFISFWLGLHLNIYKIKPG